MGITNLPTTGSSVGVFHPSLTIFGLRDTNTSGISVTHAFTSGNPGDIPIVGDWTHSGKSY